MLRPVAQMSRLIENPVTRYDFVQKLEWFLLSAVTMILIIRTQLWLTHYPQLGGNGLHIAHLLWGGLFMVISIWFGLIYLNRWSRAVLAILGGIGFGFFIDEYRQEEAERAGRLLDMADQSDPMVGRAREMFREAGVAPSRPPSWLSRFAGRVHKWIKSLTTRPHFEGAVIAVVLLWGLATLSSAIALDLDLGGIQDSQGSDVDQGVIGSLESLSALVSVILIGYGAWAMARGRHALAYRYFGRALLVSILVTRVFIFIESQFAAVFGLAVDLILYAAISEIASQDEERGFHFGGLGEPDLAESAATPEEPARSST
jgi:hypothetical protein